MTEGLLFGETARMASGFAVPLGALASLWFALPSVAEGQAHVISIDAMRFQPETLTVRQGDRVTWVNRDLVPHTATHRAFDSGTIVPQASWTLAASKPGTYVYVCTLHPTMKAALLVQKE